MTGLWDEKELVILLVEEMGIFICPYYEMEDQQEMWGRLDGVGLDGGSSTKGV